MAQDTHHFTAALPLNAAKRIDELAKANGMTRHLFLVKRLCELAATEQMPSSVTPPPTTRERNAEALPETITTELTVRMAMQLHAAARQMRDVSGKPTSPATLARLLMIHECQGATDIVDRIAAECDPAYVDIVPFLGRLRTRRGQDWHLLVFRCTFPTREAIHREAKRRKTTIADLVRDVIQAYTPALPWK